MDVNTHLNAMLFDYPALRPAREKILSVYETLADSFARGGKLLLCSNGGIDPVHLGLLMVLNLMIGLLTPPTGMCLFTTARVANIKLERMVSAVIPFYIPLFLVLILCTLFPAMATWLPSIALG